MTGKGWSVVLFSVLILLAGIIMGYITSSRQTKTNMIAAQEPPVSEDIQEEKPKEPFLVPSEPEKEAAAVNTEKYMVTLSDNRLFIYKIMTDGTMEQVEDKEVDTASLRHDDYGELYKGIIFDTITEAREVMEDYVN